jgi:hypothetical protein
MVVCFFCSELLIKPAQRLKGWLWIAELNNSNGTVGLVVCDVIYLIYEADAAGNGRLLVGFR